jgi:hypothetical protein
VVTTHHPDVNFLTDVEICIGINFLLFCDEGVEFPTELDQLDALLSIVSDWV